jgi:hypothetical protein
MNLFTQNSPYYHLLKYLLFLLKHPVYATLYVSMEVQKQDLSDKVLDVLSTWDECLSCDSSNNETNDDCRGGVWFAWCVHKGNGEIYKFLAYSATSDCNLKYIIQICLQLTSFTTL